MKHCLTYRNPWYSGQKKCARCNTHWKHTHKVSMTDRERSRIISNVNMETFLMDHTNTATLASRRRFFKLRTKLVFDYACYKNELLTTLVMRSFSYRHSWNGRQVVCARNKIKRDRSTCLVQLSLSASWYGGAESGTQLNNDTDTTTIAKQRRISTHCQITVSDKWPRNLYSIAPNETISFHKRY